MKNERTRRSDYEEKENKSKQWWMSNYADGMMLRQSLIVDDRVQSHAIYSAFIVQLY